MNFGKVYAFLLVLLLVSSCSDDTVVDMVIPPDTNTIGNQLDNYNPVEELVTASVLGTVIDELDNPVADATVRHRGEVYLTDENGIFFIKDASFNSNGSFFTVQKDGYFKGSRTFYPQRESINYAYVQLMRLNDIGQFDATNGGQVSGTDGIVISFPSNAIQAEGSLYTGEVSVAAKWLDPNSPNVNILMPGDLVGLDTNGEEMSLVSYGMMAVELFGTSGELLNIASGSMATLSFPVPESMLGNAPSEIPLWSFEEEDFGIWVEEGNATLQDGRYVGDVSHFSFWNCDAPFPLVTTCGQLLTSDGTPIANAVMRFESIEELTGSRNIGSGLTDNNGFFIGKLPQNAELTLSVSRNYELCTIESFENIMVGPLPNLDKVDLGIIELEESAVDLPDVFTISGTVIDCDGNLVENGLVKIGIRGTSSINNKVTTFTYLTENDGSFNIGFLNCTSLDNFSITATDVDNSMFGNPIQKKILPAVDCGNVIACGNDICITDLQFVGEYRLTLDANAGLEYGLPYNNDIVVTLSLEEGAPNVRSFFAQVLPDIGGFGPYQTFFEITCDNKALYQLMNSQGLGCGGGGIMFGPSFDSNGQQIAGSIDVADDSEIELFFDEGFADGGCIGNQGETATRLVLTKI